MKIAEFCRRNYIRKLSLFGSVLRSDFREDSDVDVLVEFHPDNIPGFIRFGQIEDELSQIINRQNIDLVTSRFLNKSIREDVIQQAEIQYAKNDLIYIGLMLDSALQALELNEGKNRDDFDREITLQLSLTHLVQIIGEAARKISREFCSLHPQIDWKNIIGMRHRVVHDYLNVDEKICVEDCHY